MMIWIAFPVEWMVLDKKSPIYFWQGVHKFDNYNFGLSLRYQKNVVFQFF